MIEKRCTRCLEWKSLESFSPLKAGPMGRHSYCKSCRSALNGATQKLQRTYRNRSPRDEIWPRSVVQGLLDVNCRKWTGPVDRQRQLTWRIA